MRKMDEMDRNIQLRSAEWAYRTVMLALSVWVLFNCWQTLVHGADYQILPGLIVCLGGSVQGFYQLAAKQKMVAGDEEYRQPNKFLQTVLATIVLTVILISVGVYVAVAGK